MSPNCSCKKIFNEEEEKFIEDYLVKCSQMNYGLTKVKFQRMVYELAIKNNKNIPESWNKNKSAGKDWLYGFMKRHTNLSLRSLKPAAFPGLHHLINMQLKNFF